MSMQTRQVGVTEVPLSQIKRPIPPVLDYGKIDAMVSTLGGVPMASATCKIEDIEAGELPPIDVFRIRDSGKDYYFAFGGCHRFQAYDRISTQQKADVLVRCRLIPASKSTLKLYLGAGADKFFKEIQGDAA